MNTHAEQVAPAMLSLAARIDQLHAAICQGIDLSYGLTSYPREDTPQAVAASAKPVEQTLLGSIDECSMLVERLNCRLERLNEVLGGRV